MKNFFLFFFLPLKIGLLCVALVVLKLLYRPGWPQSAGIEAKAVHYHHPAGNEEFQAKVNKVRHRVSKRELLVRWQTPNPG